MAYYEDEILRELNVGEEYTSRQIAILIQENKNATILSKSIGQFSTSSDRKIKLLDKIEAYKHYYDQRSFSYMVPSSKSTTYIFE